MHLEKKRTYACTFPIQRKEINVAKVSFAMSYSSRKLSDEKVITTACNSLSRLRVDGQGIWAEKFTHAHYVRPETSKHSVLRVEDEIPWKMGSFPHQVGLVLSQAQLDHLFDRSSLRGEQSSFAREARLDSSPFTAGILSSQGLPYSHALRGRGHQSLQSVFDGHVLNSASVTSAAFGEELLSHYDEPRSGGYDEFFDPPLESKYECPICLLGLREPVQTSCGHRFCKGCILRSIR